MKSYTDLKREIANLALRGRFSAYVELLGVIDEIMAEHKIKPIVVGGMAIEIYTRCGYFVEDIDIMMKNSRLLKSVLDKLGFVERGNHYFIPGIEVGVEILPMDSAIDLDKISVVRIPSGREIYVIGIEDLVLDRLRIYFAHDSYFDYEWACRIYIIHRGIMDIDYLWERAAKINEKAMDVIKSWK